MEMGVLVIRENLSELYGKQRSVSKANKAERREI